VYGIVRQSGGCIRVDSAPGRGASFEIYLPRVQEKAELPEKSREADFPAKGVETVLVVEDEEMVRELVCEVLRKNGYSVLEARHGEEALRISEGHRGPIHLLVTDVVMPRMRGNDLAERIAPLRPETKVIYMSGYTDNAELYGRPGGTNFTFIQKPFRPATLSRVVRTVLDSRPGVDPG
jgi:DNA-binding NtrC family response regulator